MACKTTPEALLGGAGVGLGGSWAALGAAQDVSGKPWEAPGKGSGRPLWRFFGGRAEEAAEEGGKSSEIFGVP